MTEPNCLLDGEHQVWHADSLNQEHVARVMGGRNADLLCFDAPYSEKTHSGHDGGKLTADRAASFARTSCGNPTPEQRYAARKSAAGESGRRAIDYAAFGRSEIRLFCEAWISLTAGWFVTITDHVLVDAWSAELESRGRYVFAPLPLVETGSRVRMTGDGPSNWTCWIVVARPRELPYSKWGTLPGAYVQPSESMAGKLAGRIVGGKPFRSMCAIVSDYSRPGDLVVDPCCGGGTTLSAARYVGRRALGIDQKLEHAQLSAKALGKARHQPELFG